MATEAEEHLNQQPVDPREEVGHTVLSEDAVDLVGNPDGIVGSETLIYHSGQDDLVLRVGQQAHHLILNVSFFIRN